MSNISESQLPPQAHSENTNNGDQASSTNPFLVQPDSAHAVFVAWERLRIIYNIVLAAVVLLVGFNFLFIDCFLVLLFYYALFANLCFCLGPVVEGYLSLLGMERERVRWALFFLGTVFACLLAFLAISTWVTEPFD